MGGNTTGLVGGSSEETKLDVAKRICGVFAKVQIVAMSVLWTTVVGSQVSLPFASLFPGFLILTTRSVLLKMYFWAKQRVSSLTAYNDGF